MFGLSKAPAQLCQTCRHHAHIHRHIVQRNISSVKQHTCTVINSKNVQTNYNKLGCTFRVPVYNCLFNSHQSLFNPAAITGNCDADKRSLSDSSSSYARPCLEEHSNLFSSFGNIVFYDSHQNDVSCTTNLCTERNEESINSNCTIVKPFKYCGTSSNVQRFNDKYISSIKRHNTYRIRGQCLHSLQNYSWNSRGISASTSVSNLQNGHNSPVNQTCFMFHTSAGNRVLHTVESDGNSVDIKLSPPWKILFFGTDEIAVITLKALYENMITSRTLVESIDVVTVPQRHAVYRFAESVNLQVKEWPVKVQPYKYDVGILVSFGHLIPDNIIHMFPYGILNMHPSLLPRWRGASPIIHTVLNGDETTGVSIMEIRPRHFDIGPLLLQRMIDVPDRCTSLQLLDILGHFGSKMVLECLKDLPALERFEHEQDRDGITYAHKLKRSDAFIDWDRHTASQIDCQYRAIFELMPLKTILFGQTIKLVDVVDPNLLTDISSQNIKGFPGDLDTALPGTVGYITKHDCIVIKCKDGFIGFKNVVVKNNITAKDFCNGYLRKNRCTQFTSLSNNLNKFIKHERIPLGSKA